jgi:enamine deaminase RidA (YjgF/YER057c/UK114 family)
MKWDLKKYPMYISGIKQTYPSIKLGMPFLSKSAVVGNLIFLSGLTGISLETGYLLSHKFEDQMVGCLNNIQAALKETGSSMDNLVKHLVFIKNVEDCQSMWKIMLDYYQKHAPGLLEEPPALTVIPVKSFLEPGCLVEVDSMAVLFKDAPGWEMKKYPVQYRSTAHNYPGIDPSMPLISESVVVGNLLFLSGMSGENPKTGRIETKDFELQMDIGFDKIKKAFDKAGSSASNIIKTLHLLARLESILIPSRNTDVSYSPASDRLWKRELEHYDIYAPVLLDDPPGSTFLKLQSLEDPESMTEVDVTGVISPQQPDWEVRKYPLYYGKRGFPRHIGEIKKYYANTVVVGSLIFISGQTPTDQFTGRIETDTFEDQMKITLDNLRAAVEETGSSLNNLVKTYVLMPNLEYYSIMRRLELEYYQKYAPKLVEEPPVSTLIQPLNLASPKMMIEIDAIGFLPRYEIS